MMVARNSDRHPTAVIANAKNASAGLVAPSVRRATTTANSMSIAVNVVDTRAGAIRPRRINA
ncbi:MAG: hypothetical protein E6J72_02205 [Deltaproteobacteria bacterium]|nr:MAG: hypothetical protein E6J72_02205 [Deltaproteobacteria bacterium]